MPQFRLTQKYATDYRLSKLEEPRITLQPLDDWFIDVIRANRKKVAMVTHAKSTYTFFIPYGQVGGAKAIPECIGVLLQQFLHEHDFPKHTEEVERLFNEPFSFCKTVDKKVLGHMNDFKRCVSYTFTEQGNDYSKAEKMIAEMPVNFNNSYDYPIKLLSKLLNANLRLK